MNTTELRWSTFEQNVINQAREMISDNLEDKTVIPPDSRIHILSPGEFNNTVIKPEQRGYVDAIVSKEHLYIKRTRTKSRFIQLFSHELLHFVSFLGPGKVGMNRIVGSHRYFEGFDEAVTELFAINFRQLLARRISAHHMTQRALRDTHAYVPAILLVKALIARSDKEGTKQIPHRLYRDYIEGTQHVLASFNYHIPGSWQALKHMGKSDEEATRVATELGLNEVLEELMLIRTN